MALSLSRRFLAPSNLRAVQSVLSFRNYADAPSGSNLNFTFSTPTQVSPAEIFISSLLFVICGYARQRCTFYACILSSKMH